MTNAEETVTVYCCRRDNTPVSVTCGQGLSCAGKCSAQDSTLCPRGDCSGTCEITLEEAPPPPTTSGGVLPPATKPSEAYRRCYPRCKVKGEENQHCCFHPECLKLRPRLCSWVNDLTGKKKDWTKTFRGRNTSKQDIYHRQDRHNKQDNRDKVIKTIYEIVSFAISKRYVDFFTSNFHPVR